MITKRAIVIVVATLLVAAGIVAAQVGVFDPCLPISEDLSAYSQYEFKREAPFTGSLGDAAIAVEDHLENGTPLPAGVTLLGTGPTLEAKQTGVVLNVAEPPTTLVQYLLTIEDDTASDLEEVRLSINNQLVQTATRSNGKIVDGVNKSIATLTHFINPCDLDVVQVEVLNEAQERFCINLSQ